MIKELLLNIAARPNAPTITLFVKIVSKDEASLRTKPYLFVLPGGPGFNHSFYQAYECLQDVVNVVFHDPRGCGLSGKSEVKFYTMENNIDDVEFIRTALKLNKCIILGKSYGSMCALAYALKYPNHIEKLILAAGAPSYRFIESAKANLLKIGTPAQQKLCEKVWQGTFESADDILNYNKVMSPLYSYKIRHNQFENIKAASIPPDPEPLNYAFQTFLNEFDFEDKLDNIKCETLILAGDEDWINDKKHALVMADNIPLNKCMIFPKAGHALEIDVPEYFNLIRSFCELGVSIDKIF